MAKIVRELPGLALTPEDISQRKVLSTSWVPKAEYAWDAGIAMGRYLEELRNGRLMGVRHRRCGRTVIPPRIFCEQCFAPMDEWGELPDTGTVNTFSICYVSWDVKRLEVPEIPAVIEIDGTSPRVGILHKLGEVDPQQVKVGMPVKAVWKPAEERNGAITDILYFQPI
ncbi:MAG: Zn-ribbon domain-containing OB-fold protein [Chloroflexi bacterium]|nr:Zn-ribbon domain-containing OB-fold protein [Chloroflexota bacterium]